MAGLDEEEAALHAGVDHAGVELDEALSVQTGEELSVQTADDVAAELVVGHSVTYTVVTGTTVVS